MTHPTATRTSLIMLSTAVVVGLTFVSGWVHGQLSNRWGPPLEMGPIVERLEAFPEQFGAWRMRAEKAMEPNVEETLQCSGYVVREYVHSQTGEIVNMALIVGPSGPISVHTPEICYSSRDFTPMGERTPLAVGDGGDAFWALDFQANDRLAQAQRLRVCYGWSTGGPWSATESPRLSFAGKPYLYKLQIASYPPASAELDKDDPCRRFLEDFVPAARGCLVDSVGE